MVVPDKAAKPLRWSRAAERIAGSVTIFPTTVWWLGAGLGGETVCHPQARFFLFDASFDSDSD